MDLQKEVENGIKQLVKKHLKMGEVRDLKTPAKVHLSIYIGGNEENEYVNRIVTTQKVVRDKRGKIYFLDEFWQSIELEEVAYVSDENILYYAVRDTFAEEEKQ